MRPTRLTKEEEEEEEKRLKITLSRSLQGQVKEKVETFEEMIHGQEVLLECPDEGTTPPKGASCPEPTPTFQIKSESGASMDSKSPFDL